MKQISLNGQWDLWYYPEGSGIEITSPDQLEHSQVGHIKAAVPGNIELDLYAAGLEPEPFFGCHLMNYRKYEFYSWWFVRFFTLPADFSGEEYALCLDGVDTYADVYLNGIRIGSTDNMLIGHEIKIAAGDILREENKIAVHIFSTMNTARKRDYPVGLTFCEKMGDELTMVRKAPSCFGWDILGRFVSAGLWKDVRLEARYHTHLKEVYYGIQSLSTFEAQVRVRYRFATDDPFLSNFAVRVVMRFNGEVVAEQRSNAPFVSGKLQITIPSPHFWWPKGYGEAALYDVTLELLNNQTVIDTRQERIGLREIELERAYGEEKEKQFLFRVNGTPILIKGSNWVPLDALHSRDLERLDGAFAFVKDIGINMLRCWGGNVYESDRFFELCDENGILVWQDFAFACAFYSQYDDFAKIVEKEAAAVIRRLRNHPCIAVWAGDNELDEIYVAEGHRLPHNRNNRISREILPRAVMMHDPFRDYLPSSPYLPLDMAEPSEIDVPEQHTWGPRDYFKSDFYKNCTARFISETGYHGCPAQSSLKRFLPEKELWPIDKTASWRAHNTDFLLADLRSYNRNELMENQVKVLFGEKPSNLSKFVTLSQISQAEADKFFIETTRIQKWKRTGILWWNLLDGWPQISDAVVDYYFTKKLAYHYIKRISGPVCLIMGESEAWKHRLVLCNDSREDFAVSYRVVDGETGETLRSGVEQSIANENLELPPFPSIPGEQKLYLLYWIIEGKEYANHYISGFVPFAPEKMCKWLEAIARLPETFRIEDCVE